LTGWCGSRSTSNTTRPNASLTERGKTPTIEGDEEEILTRSLV
jgi:hypothetical protein